jgi:AcrR family transcriptional regulator
MTVRNDNAVEQGTGTRDRILAAAAKILSTRGYSETRLTDIAEYANVRPPAVYYYFPSREAVIAEVMAVGQERLLSHVNETLNALPPSATAMDRVCGAIQAHLEVALHLSDFATAVTGNLGQLPVEVRTPLDTGSNAYAAVWRQLLDDARAAGELRPGLNLRAARLLVMGALNWAPEWWNPEHGSLATVIQTAQSLVRNGLGVTQSPPGLLNLC